MADRLFEVSRVFWGLSPLTESASSDFEIQNVIYSVFGQLQYE